VYVSSALAARKHPPIVVRSNPWLDRTQMHSDDLYELFSVMPGLKGAIRN
jgi:hypothetical protein